MNTRKSARYTNRLITAMIAASITVFSMITVAAPALPREPMPKPHLPGTFHPNPKPPIHIGTRPHFNPSNIGALPDLKIMRVIPRINSRVAGICRTGRKDRPGGSIPVLNFDVVVKNVGRGTAYMDRYGVILSAQTMDFHERVFDTNKRYQGGTGGPGHFQGPHGSQPWLLFRMAPIAPGASFTAHSGLGIGYNNTRFTIARMHELAGQTHRFRIKLTSYGSPGLKESNTRNNEYIVRYTFPRDFCKTTVQPVRPVTQAVPVLPDFVISKLTPPNVFACSSNGHIATGFFHPTVFIQNKGGNPTYPASASETLSNFTLAHRVIIPGTQLRFRVTGGIRYRNLPKAHTTIHSPFSVGLWNDHMRNGQADPQQLAKAINWLRGRKINLPIIVNGPKRSDLSGKPALEGNTRNNTKALAITFPNKLCRNLTDTLPVRIHAATPSQYHLTGAISAVTLEFKKNPLPGNIRTHLKFGYDLTITARVTVTNTGRDASPPATMMLLLRQKSHPKPAPHKGVTLVRNVSGRANPQFTVSVPAIQPGGSFTKQIAFSHLPHSLWDADNYDRILGKHIHHHIGLLGGYSCGYDKIMLARNGAIGAKPGTAVSLAINLKLNRGTGASILSKHTTGTFGTFYPGYNYGNVNGGKCGF